MDCSMPGLPVCHQLLESTQSHVHWVHDAIQPSHPLSSPSPPTFNLSQHQGLFQWVGCSNQVAKGLEFQFHHLSFQWIFRVDLDPNRWEPLLTSIGVGQKENKKAHLLGAEEVNQTTLKQEWAARTRPAWAWRGSRWEAGNSGGRFFSLLDVSWFVL